MRLTTALRFFLVVQLLATVWAIVYRLPYAFGGTGSPDRVFEDFWTRGTALSAPAPFLLLLAVFGVISRRKNRVGTVAAGLSVVMLIVAVVAGLFEPAFTRALQGEIPMVPATGVLVLIVCSLITALYALGDAVGRLRT